MNTLALSSESPIVLIDAITLLLPTYRITRIWYTDEPARIVFHAEFSTGAVCMTPEELTQVTDKLKAQAKKLGEIATPVT